MRVNAMLLDYTKFATPDRTQWLSAGSVPFALNMYCQAKVEVAGQDGQIHLNNNIRRPSIVLHAARIMQQALSVQDGLRIEVVDEPTQLHIGLGSSPSLQTAVASALNILYGSRIPAADMVKYLVSNYGEEIDGDPNHLIPVQAMGAAAAVGLCGGGLLVMAGEATVVARMHIPDTHQFVIATPTQTSGDAVAALIQDIETYEFLQAIATSSRVEIAYTVLNALIPAMIKGDLRQVGAVISQTRLSEQQLQRYAARYPNSQGFASGLPRMFKEGLADVVSISSTGPTVFALTKTPDKVRDMFLGEGAASIFTVKPNNVGMHYSVS